nr:ABC transporter permease subunit [Dickeya dianthicola]
MGRIDAVGLVFPLQPAPLSNTTFMDMVAEISHELAKQEIDLLLIADEEQAESHAFLRMIESRRVDALIVAHTLQQDSRLQYLQSIGFPFLALGRSDLPAPYAWFDFDNQAGAALATRRLIALGHRHVAFLGEHHPQSFIAQRRAGYLEALTAAGIAQRDALLRQVALFAWLPLITAWVGNDDGGKVTFIALVAFFPMLVATHRGVHRRSLALQEVAQVLRLPWLRRLRVLILPGAAPALFTGLRLAMIYAWLGAIGAEYFMSSGAGIGSLMINAQQLLDMPLILSGMLLIGVTGALIDSLGQRLEQRMTRWRTPGDSL